MTFESSIDALALVAVVSLLIGLSLLLRRQRVDLREIPAFSSLRRAIEHAVEAGERVHMSLGTGSVTGADSAAALAGLTTFSHVVEMTAIGDKPPVVTAGDGALAVLAQDSLRGAYDRIAAAERYDPTSGRMLGPTPFSYVAALPIVLNTEDVSVHMLSGSFGLEAGLAADFGERRRAFVIGGSEDVRAQALLYATAEQPLIGEEVFAGGAYMSESSVHKASLLVQDALRVVIALSILIASFVALVEYLA